MKKVMFLCTANSCRSQMAEGLARKLCKEVMEIHSAGLMSAGIHRNATIVMREIGIDISEQKSKTVDEFLLRKMDYVVILCKNADSLCPRTNPKTKRFYWPIKDPVGTQGTEEEIMEEFRRARDEIKKRVQQLKEEMSS
jgi:arsenate reductase